ncbi:MAG TPA: hypothetical protein HPP54_10140 [Nitrospinae bacterium]|nr:hypothetical protein [Nitrospinota bacterium]
MRGRLEKERRQEEALERAAEYKAPENPTGLRERVRRGMISVDEAIAFASGYNDNIRAWLRRRKANNTKVSSKTKGGKQKRKDAKKNTKSNS